MSNPARKSVALGEQFAWLSALLLILIGCIWLSWLGQAKFQYGFGFWYKIYDIEAHIDKYGPQNRYKRGLNRVEPEEHIDLFGQISESVHNGGVGLADIRYRSGSGFRALLRKPEVIHLQDVANLIDLLRPAGLVALVLGGLITAGLFRRNSRPSWRAQFGLMAGLSVLIAAVFVLVGAKAVFYQMHVWIFPEDHEWFFYYQDSLMATLMKAPDLFGGIAAAIVTGGMMLFAAWMYCVWRILQHQAKPLRHLNTTV